MNKIMRLALANLRRHKTESVMLGILVMLCTGLLAGAFCAERNVRRMFPEMAERTGFYHNRISIAEEEDAVRGLEILKQDERVTDCAVIRYLYATAARIIGENGQEPMYPCRYRRATRFRSFRMPRDSRLRSPDFMKAVISARRS